jgi:cytochrome c553
MKIRLIVTLVMGLAVAAGVARAADLSPQAIASAARIAIGTCAGCHGARGVSALPKFPVLAAQPASYLAAQIREFRNRIRKDPDALAFMWGMAASLDDSQIDAIAQYYAAQRAPSGPTRDPDARARGKDIYEKGILAQNVPPCVGCHGAKGEGLADSPRLAGQHPQYFVDTMRSYQKSFRTADPMRDIAIGLGTRDLEALAAFVQSE